MDCQPIIQVAIVLLILSTVGGLIGLAEMLWSGKSYTNRQLLGGTILGSATSAIAGGVLHFVPNMSMIAVISLGCILGLLGHTYIRNAVMKKVNTQFKLGDDDDESRS